MIPGEQPFTQFNIVIQLGSGEESKMFGGFQECSGIHLEEELISVVGKTPGQCGVTKITGMNKSTDVTLKRGVVSAPALNEWLKEVREGKKVRDVTLVLQSEDRSKPPKKWKLVRARITKHTSGPLNAKGTDVTMEQLVISCKRIELL